MEQPTPSAEKLAHDTLTTSIDQATSATSDVPVSSSVKTVSTAPSVTVAFCTALDIASHPVDHLTFDQFVATIAALRAPDGCPWDREQTHESIAKNMVEEAYEAVDAIEASDIAHLREELGDVLLQVVLQSQIAADAGEFDIDDVCADVNAKIVRRHPHVFGQARVDSVGEVLDLWDQVKLVEKEDADKASEAADMRPAGLLDGVPRSFPALMQAQKISRKAVAAGFEWEMLDDIWAQVREEIEELHAAYAEAPKESNGKVDSAASPEAFAAVELELGDVLFSLVNVARRMGIDSESALRATCGKFRNRWAFMEEAAKAQGTRVEDLSSDERERLWNEAKNAARFGT